MTKNINIENTELDTVNQQFDNFELFEKFNIKLTSHQKKQLADFYQILISENEKYNLTAITEINEVYEKHFLDSMLGASFIKQNAKVCDIGAGGGFPSVPLKILRPDISFLLCDSTKKKTDFLSMVATKLGLENVETIHSRIEDLANTSRRESFDVVVSRGVAPLATLLEYKMPLAKIGGIALCYKGDVQKEIDSAKNAFKVLGCTKYRTHEYSISNSQNKRCLLIVDKSVEISKKYPRSKNQPRTNPL